MLRTPSSYHGVSDGRAWARPSVGERYLTVKCWNIIDSCGGQ
jgi:hypothetical protein